MIKDCRKKQKEQGQGSNQQKKPDGDTLVTLAGEVGLLSANEELCLHVANQDAEWVVDTAVSYHATPHIHFFCTYKTGDYGTVRMGNTSSSKIIGIGNIHVKTNIGCTMVLKDVRHVPDLRLNLISGTALDRQGYVSHFGDGT